MPTVIAPDTRIGSYVIERQLGAGGMGAVYLARREPDGLSVALKLMHEDVAEKLEARKRFLREARATMALDHDNVVKIIETFESEGRPVIVMEHLKGQPLSSVLEARGKLSVRDASQIFLRVVSAVGSAHALGLVHRDLKPDNVLVLDEEPYVKVLDFGIAKMRKGYALEESSALTRTGMLVGTPFYMSPEQAFGEKTIDHRADIWTLGLMLYEALSGGLPTRAATLHEVFTRLMTHPFVRLDRVDASIPADLATLVERMVCRDRAGRPADLRPVFQVLAAHAGALDDEPTSFDAAVEPISFGSSGDAPASAATPPSGSAEDAAALAATTPSRLQLTPQSLRAVEGRLTPAGTMILAEEPAPAPALAPTTLTSAIYEPPKRASGVWMWALAVLVVVACVVALAMR